MAELNVEPKKKSPIGWIILIIIIVLIILYFIFRGSNSGNNRMNNTATDTTGMMNKKDTNHATASDTTNNTNNTVAATSGWEGINYIAPTQNYSEITDKDIEVRNDNKYAVYSLGENILFDENKSTIRPSAEKEIKQTAASKKKQIAK